MSITDKKCPWCGKGLNIFQFLIEIIPWGRHEIGCEIYFPCPHCKKSLLRRNNNQVTKKTARKMFFLFIIPPFAWYLMDHLLKTRRDIMPVITLGITTLCLMAYSGLVLYAGSDIVKEE